MRTAVQLRHRFFEGAFGRGFIAACNGFLDLAQVTPERGCGAPGFECYGVRFDERVFWRLGYWPFQIPLYTFMERRGL